MNARTLSQLISGLSDTHRPIRLRIASADKALDNVLMVQHLSGQERINSDGDCLAYTLHCVSTQAGLALKDFIACPVEIQFVTERGALHSVCGLVQDIRAGQPDGGLAAYQLVVRDALSLMQGRTNTRVFLNSDELQITNVLLREWREHNPGLARCFDIDWSALSGSYPARAFTMQANETDTQFLTRLWKRRGINWFIRAGPPSQRPPQSSQDPTPQHTLVLFNNVHLLPKPPDTPWPYRPSNGSQQRDRIYSWQAARTLVPGNLTRHSWDYQTPGLSSISRPGTSNQGTLGNQFAANLHDSQLDPPHTGNDRDDYLQLTERRIEYHEYRAKSFQADSDLRHVQLGDSFILGGHPEIDSHPPEQRQFVITELEVNAHNNLPTDLSDQIDRLFAANGWQTGLSQPSVNSNDGSSDTRYRNRFTCVRRGIPIVPAYDPRTDLPTIHPMTAMVVTDPGEEITCNALGCARVTIPGCMIEDHAHAKGAGASGTSSDSAWIRVASNWASTGYGTSALCRKGDEVLLQFLNGNCDKPLITNRVHNASAPPVAFNHTGNLPGNKALSGIKSKELNGQRYNQLRLDDTPKQISAQLASQHAYSELNLGYLTHPRTNGQAESRGEGAELRSDAHIAVRAAKGLLLSAWQRLHAVDSHLARTEYLDLMQQCLEQFRSLGHYAAEHQALPIDDQPQADLHSAISEWEHGSNTAPDAQAGGAPVISITAPAGLSFATPKCSISYAGVNHDNVAQQHMQLTAGQRFNVNAGKGISLFAHHDGIQAIAHHGKLTLQSQQDDTQIQSARNVQITASDGNIVLMAKQIHAIAEDGSFIKIGDGITFGTNGEIKHQAANFKFTGPATMASHLPVFQSGQPDQKFLLKYGGQIDSAVIAPNRHYEIAMSDGSVIKGISDALGKTSILEREAMHIADVKIIPDPL